MSCAGWVDIAEALKDTVFGVAPLTLADALAMLDRLRCRSMLDGYRGYDPVDKMPGTYPCHLGDLGARIRISGKSTSIL